MAPKVSEEHREGRRAELLDSALACFSEHGYEATTVDQIVQTAGASKGMLYTYFDSKEQMFVELVNQRTRQFLGRLNAAFATLPSAWDKLSYLLESYRLAPLDGDARKWTAVYLEFFLSTSRSEVRSAFMQRRYEQFLNLLVEVVEEGKQAGEFRLNVNSAAVAALYWAVSDGIHLHASQLPNWKHYDAVYKAAVQMLHQYLRVES